MSSNGPSRAGSAEALVAAMVGLCQGRPSLAAPLRSATARLEGDTLLVTGPVRFFHGRQLQPREHTLLARAGDDATQEGTIFVTDVYRGSGMERIPRGTVKYLRVVESPEKRHWSPGAWFGQGYTAPAMNWHSLENKRILGTVPVEDDGSAAFAVPSETFVYFQLLDEHGMMIQSMRSGASVQSGERAACVGCHEDRRATPPAMLAASREPSLPLAWRRPPSRLSDWYGPPREFSFMAEVQPVFNKRCVGCHDYGQEAGRKLNLAPDRTLTFNTALCFRSFPEIFFPIRARLIID